VSSLVKAGGTWHLYYVCLPTCLTHPGGKTRHHVSLQLRDRKAAVAHQREFDEKQEIQKARLKLGLSITQSDPHLKLSQLAERYYAAMQSEKAPAPSWTPTSRQLIIC
jgi:hypothetical protein